jgi:hypothetical protein
VYGRLIRALPWLDVLGGIWLIVGLFRWVITDVAQMWTSIILGIVVLIIGFLMFYGTRMAPMNWYWISWINVILGLGAIAYPFYFGLTGGVMISYIWTGFLISAAAALFVLSGHLGRTTTGRDASA